METMVERDSKKENEKESFKFVVSPNREVGVRLRVENLFILFILLYFVVYKSNLSVEFVFKAKIMKTKNKHMTAMFAAFQKSWVDVMIGILVSGVENMLYCLIAAISRQR